MASKQYLNPETRTTWKSTGGDLTLTFASTPDQALAVGAQLDRGTGAKPALYRWQLVTQVNATVTVGRMARIYLVGADDTTDIPGRISTTDSEITSASDRIRNFTNHIGNVVADTTSTTDKVIVNGEAWIDTRYVSPAIFNDFGVALNASETNQYFWIQPIPPEQQ
jgi:hypothetical protein